MGMNKSEESYQPPKKAIGDFQGYKVYQVDGAGIRKNKDEEFTNFGSHSDYEWIPEKELWLDKGVHPAEAHIFIDRMIKQDKLQAGGMSLDKVRKAGDRYEESERSKIFGGFGSPEREEHSGDPRVREIPLRWPEGTSAPIKFYIVDGEKIRNGRGTQHEDFTEGGNGGAYKWVPRDEVWIEDTVQPGEVGYVALHELHERRLMLGAGWDYLKAHRSSSMIEHVAREHPPLLPHLLRAEMLANAKTP